MPLGTLPFTAPLPSLLSLLGGRDHGESRLPLPLPFLLMSCLTLHDSPLELLPFCQPLFKKTWDFSVFTSAHVISFPPGGTCVCCPVVSRVEVSILCHLIQVPVNHFLQASAACGLIHMYCILVVQSKYTFPTNCIQALSSQITELRPNFESNP